MRQGCVISGFLFIIVIDEILTTGTVVSARGFLSTLKDNEYANGLAITAKCSRRTVGLIKLQDVWD